MELRSHIIHLRIIYIFFCNGFVPALLCCVNKRKIIFAAEGGGWLVAAFLAYYKSVQQCSSPSPRSLSLSRALIYLCSRRFTYSCIPVVLLRVCVPSCCAGGVAQITRASRKKAPTEQRQTPRKMGKKSLTPPALGHHLLYQKRLPSIG
jgi:hypothetical protein